MRIKTYTAASMDKAMNQVRLEMGAEAIILSSQELQNGDVQLTAAFDQKELPPEPSVSSWSADWDQDWKAEAGQSASPSTSGQKAVKAAPCSAASPSKKMELLVQSMAYHGIPTVLGEKLCRTALSLETDDTTISLAAALDNHFKYSSRVTGAKSPLMLVGPPGVGKTATIAKFAAAAKMEGRSIHLITTDTSRAGAIDQLQAYADILEFKLHVAETDKQLAKLIASPALSDGTDILIDTGGINAYDENDIADLARKIIAAKAEPMAVLAAGTDSAEMSDLAGIFASLGAKRMIVTRLDTTRRYGGLFTAAHSANLSFSYASVSPSVATGLHVFNPVNLARLLLRDPTQSGVSSEFNKVVS